MFGSGRVRGFLERDGSGVCRFSSSSERIIGFHIQNQREREIVTGLVLSSNKRGMQEKQF